MDPVSSGTPPLNAEEELAAAYKELHQALERREIEHARQGRNRTIFVRAVLLVFIGIVVGLFVMVKTFDSDVFTAELTNKITKDAPGVLRTAQDSFERLVPVYQSEVTKTFPSFSVALTDTASKEADKLGDALAPLAHGDPANYTGEADGELAKKLMERFGKDLHNDFGEARAVAGALRAQQILNSRTVLDNELAGPFAALHDMELSLRGMGAPDKEIVTKGEGIEVLADAALDVVKTRLISGEGFSFSDAKEGRGTKKAGGK